MAKKKKCPEFENHERWLVSYADMVTLLFAVFVVLYSLNVSAKKNVEAVAGSMQESFNTPLEDIPVDRRIGPSESGRGIFEHFRGDQSRPPLLKKYPGRPTPSKIIDDEFNRLKIQLEERLYGPNKFQSGKKPGEARVVDIQRTANGFRLRLAARHFYAPGATEIRRESRKDLDTVIDLLKSLGRPVTIEGHTDSLPPGGNMTNWELSTLRATNVIKYMIREKNFPATQLSAAGYADLRQIAHNGTESGRALNRRIEINVNYNSVDDVDPE